MKRPTELAAILVAAAISILDGFGIKVDPKLAAGAVTAIAVVITFIVSRLQKKGKLESAVDGEVR